MEELGYFWWHRANDAANESRKRSRIRIHSFYTQKPLKRFDSIVLFVISNNNSTNNNYNYNTNNPYNNKSQKGNRATSSLFA